MVSHTAISGKCKYLTLAKKKFSSIFQKKKKAACETTLMVVSQNATAPQCLVQFFEPKSEVDPARRRSISLSFIFTI